MTIGQHPSTVYTYHWEGCRKGSRPPETRPGINELLYKNKAHSSSLFNAVASRQNETLLAKHVSCWKKKCLGNIKKERKSLNAYI